jgi:molybdopterin-guanine dinucleotide biosynthesis protein A
MEITGIILAGGKSSRFGEDKGLYQLNNQSMIESSISVAKEYCDRVVIISNNSEYDQFGLEVFEDVISDKGPLGGIYTGLINSDTDLNLILSCDIPSINQNTISKLLEKHNGRISLLEDSTGINPLIGIYHKDVSGEIKASIDIGELKVMQALKSIDPKLIQQEETISNINTKEDLESWQNI